MIAIQIGKTALALVGCILMPILIWIALGAAVYQRLVQKEPLREPVPTFR